MHDHLHDFADLLSWSEQAGTVGGNRARLLRRRGELHPDAARGTLTHAKELREATYAVFVTDDGLDWSWTHDRELDCLIWPIVRSAVDAVTGADFSPIKQCTGHDGSCGWLFHATSKNGLRRWCSMQACGTWEKSRRHTEHRAQRRAEPDGR